MTEIILISIALAMDCFSVSIAAGVTARRMVIKPMLLMVLAFGIFQGGMTLIGYLCMRCFSGWIGSIDHWIAFFLLTYLGLNMILTLWRKESPLQLPQSGESPVCRLLEIKNIPMLAVATSIDALAVGISFACVGFGQLSSWCTFPAAVACTIIALTSSLFTIAGLSIGITAGKRITFPVEPIGGIVLIAIGLKILIEHLS